MVPLSRQTDFFVPEMKEEVRTEVKEEESDEDRGTDITGYISHIPTHCQEISDRITHKSFLKPQKRSFCLSNCKYELSK